MLRNGFYNIIGAGIRIGTGILTVPILIRLVGVEEYGLWTLVSTVVNLISLAEAGLSVSTTYFLSQNLHKKDAQGMSQVLTITCGSMLIMATIAGVILYIGSESFSNSFTKLTPSQHFQVLNSIKVSGLVVWSRLLQQICMGVEQALQKFGVMNILVTLQALLTNIGILIVAQNGGKSLNFMQLQAGVGFFLLVIHVITVVYLLRDFELRLSWEKKKAASIFSYSLQTWIASLGSAIFSNVDRIIVGAILNTQTLGIYAAITSITTQINTFSSLPIQPLIPSLSAFHKESDKESKKIIRKNIRQASVLNIWIAITLGGILVNLAPYILAAILGSQTNEEYTFIFRISTIIYSLYSLNAVGYFTLFGIGLVRVNMIVVAICGMISIILIWLLSLKSGLTGAVLGNAGYILTIYISFYSLKIVGIPIGEFIKILAFPLCWLILITIFSNVFRQSILISCLLSLIECSLMGYWFLRNYRHQEIAVKPL